MQNAATTGSLDREWTLRVDSQHPAVHGPMTLRLRVDGPDPDARIQSAEVVVAPLHRGVEKLFESRDYRQALMLADRHDWHSAFGSELGLALTIEHMAGIAVPERATWIRTTMAELNRAIHHLRWLGETIGELAADEAESLVLRDSCRRARDRLTWFHEANSGGRLHPMLVVPGGVREDTPDGWAAGLRTEISALTDLADGLVKWVTTHGELSGAGVGVVPLDLATSYGASGPVARASGLALDLRLDDPYLRYDELAATGVLTRVTASAGDSQARLLILAEELRVTFAVLVAATTALDAPGLVGEPVNVRLPRSLRVPEGTGYGWTENPTGINGWFLESRGGPMPYRLKVRTASFANAQALSHVLVGETVRALPTILMTFLLVAGDLGK